MHKFAYFNITPHVHIPSVRSQMSSVFFNLRSLYGLSLMFPNANDLRMTSYLEESMLDHEFLLLPARKILPYLIN